MSIGFGAVMLLLLMTALTGYIGNNIISRSFAQYRVISNADILASEIQSNLLESRLAFKNFVQTGDEKQKTVFNEKFHNMQGYILKLKESIDDTKMNTIAEKINEDASYYKTGFDKIVDYKVRRDNLYDILNQKGPETENNLTAIVEQMYQTKNVDALYKLGMARKHLILGRLHAARFLENNDFTEAARLNEEFAKFDKWIASAESEIISISGQDALDQIVLGKETYFNRFQEMVTLIEERNNTIKYMDELGPQIAANAEDIKETLTDLQEEYGPRVNRTIQRLTFIIVMFSFFALALAAFITQRITRLVVKPVETVTGTFKKISEGEANLDVRLKANSSDELGQMALYFNKFMEKLHDIMVQNKNQSWIKTGQAELNESIRGEKDLHRISNKTIAYIAKYINMQVGAFFIKGEGNQYKLYGSYAYNAKENDEFVRTGEGLIGQAILEKQIVLVNHIPENYARIRSGLGEALPKQLVIVPCIINKEVKCVMELAAFQEISDIQLEFLHLISSGIAINVDLAENRNKTEQLLEKTLEQSEELQVQQEELQQTNEELEEQTKALRESEARLQAQQEELRVMNEELSERTKSLEIQKNDIVIKNQHLELAQSEIENKAKALETASRYKSEFLANMSHELRTPLNSILVLSQLLCDKKEGEPLTSKQQEFAQTIHTAGTDLLRLINDILDLSKVEAGKMSINIEQGNIAALIENMERNFSEIARGKNLDFLIEIQQFMPMDLETDMQRVQQILTNLLANAFKFTERGSVSLIVTQASSEQCREHGLDSMDTICLSVADTGIGIKPDKQEIIFEAFMQSDGTTSRRFGGTGLGLSISTELARLLGGKIHLTSEEGKGSCFTLLLPRKFNASTVEKQNSEEQFIQSQYNILVDDAAVVLEQEQQKEEAPKTKCMLIIEDDKVFAGILADMAAEKGYAPIIAANGKDGLRKAIFDKPSAIILDIGLPDIDGWKVIEQLEANSNTSQIPVHVITGRDQGKAKSSSDMIVGYLKKPVDLQNLNDAFKKIENLISDTVKKLLIIGDNKKFEAETDEIIKVKELEVAHIQTGKDAYNSLLTEQYDCIIMDNFLEDIEVKRLLHKLRGELNIKTPVILCSDREINQEDEQELSKYAESIIIRGNRSSERLVDEVNLFLHELDTQKDLGKLKPVKTDYHRELALSGRTILIVDDDMRNVFALSSILEEKGMKIIVGRNGIEGLERLKENSEVDLVLMDIMMPELDGYDTIKAIRSQKKFSNLPIIALTAKAMKEDRQKCIEAGASDYLTKPIDVDKLISLLRVWLCK